MLAKEFNLAWYKSELIDSVRVNVWERHLTDMLNKVEFISIIGIIVSFFLKSLIHGDVPDSINLYVLYYTISFSSYITYFTYLSLPPGPPFTS